MPGLPKQIMTAVEEQQVQGMAERITDDILSRLEEQPRISVNTRYMDWRVREQVQASLIGKDCAVTWDGRKLLASKNELTTPTKDDILK